MGLGWGVPPMGGGGYPPSQGFSFFVIGLDRKILNTPAFKTIALDFEKLIHEMAAQSP